jgi:hypothetical protein
MAYDPRKTLTAINPCGGGLEYLHRNPASCKGRQRGNPVPGGITGTTKYGFESHGTQAREGLRCRGPAANYRPVLSSERALQNNPQLSKDNFKEKKKKLVTGHDGGLTPGQTSRLDFDTDRGSAVGIAKGYGQPRGRSSRPGRVKNFSLLHIVQAGSGANPASYPMCTGGKAADV